MLVSFESLPLTSRIWIWQADQTFNEEQISAIRESVSDFCHSWETHGNPVKSSFTVKEKQFLILAVDEDFNSASGCSIDKSVNLIKNLEKQLNLSLMDRTQIAFRKDNGIEITKLPDIKEKVRSGEISADTTIFNNIITSLGELENNWQVKAGKSWLSKYFNN